jgi:hypothetical protein
MASALHNRKARGENVEKLKTYRIVEIDANDVPHVLRTGLSRADALAKLRMLRNEYMRENSCLRYVMYRDKPEPKHDLRSGDSLWTGNIAGIA